MLGLINRALQSTRAAWGNVPLMLDDINVHGVGQELVCCGALK